MGAFALALLTDEVDCVNCGIRFAVPKPWLDDRRRDKREFLCPNGHTLSYQEGIVERLQRELSAEKTRTADALARAERAERLKLAAERKEKRARKRVANGVCPCCNRTFINLQRHMGTKHPDWQTQELS